jgi:hypothetical protein
MSHPDTAKMINDQIALEFEKLNDRMTFTSEKPEILDRIRELKAMLDDNEIVAPTSTSAPSLKDIAVEAIHAFRYR